MAPLSTRELTRLSQTLARALSVDEVNQIGRDTGQATRLRTVTPHRLFLAIVSALGRGRVESLADLLRAFNYQNGVDVAYKAFYNRLARLVAFPRRGLHAGGAAFRRPSGTTRPSDSSRLIAISSLVPR